MSVVLLLLGIGVTAAGLAAVGFGIPINDLPLGSTLLLTGITGFCSGLILIGLSAAVRELQRIADAPRSRPVARVGQPTDLDAAAAAPATAGVRPPAPAVPAPKARSDVPPVREPRVAETPPPPPAPAAVDVSAAAIERLRSTIPRADRPKAEPTAVAEGEEVPLSPNGNQPAPPPIAEPPFEPRLTPADRPAAAVETVKPSRLDFLFRSRQTESRTVRSAPRVTAEPRIDEGPAPAAPAPPVASDPELRRPEPAAAAPQAPAILKSGVVDGMAYTLYADGSIEAKLPTGTVRFGSIAELRAHIESNA